MRKEFIIIFVMILAVLMGCEREFPPGRGEETNGYEIAGRVTDALGNPISNVAIKVYFDFEYVDDNPPPSMDYQVIDNSEVVRVSVYDSEDSLVRTLYNGTPGVGTLRIEWDRLLINSAFAPSGAYSVQYLVSGIVQKSYPVTVHETVTATTNAQGEFRIVNKHLPVGFYPVPLFNPADSAYSGRWRVANYVVLEFLIGGTPARAVYVALNSGTVSRVNITLE